MKIDVEAEFAAALARIDRLYERTGVRPDPDDRAHLVRQLECPTCDSELKALCRIGRWEFWIRAEHAAALERQGLCIYDDRGPVADADYAAYEALIDRVTVPVPRGHGAPELIASQRGRGWDRQRQSEPARGRERAPKRPRRGAA